MQIENTSATKKSGLITQMMVGKQWGKSWGMCRSMNRCRWGMNKVGTGTRWEKR